MIVILDSHLLWDLYHYLFILDPSILERFAPVPTDIPEWKKEIIRKKNEKTLVSASNIFCY